MPDIVNRDVFLDRFFEIQRKKAVKTFPIEASDGMFMELIYRQVVTDAGHFLDMYQKIGDC